MGVSLLPLIVVAAVVGTVVLASLVAVFSRRTHPAVRVILAIPLTLAVIAVGGLVGGLVIGFYRNSGIVERREATLESSQPKPAHVRKLLPREARAAKVHAPQALPADRDDSDTIDVGSAPQAEAATVSANGIKKNSNMAESLGEALRNAVGLGSRRQAELERQLQTQRDVFQEQMGALKSSQSEGIAKVQSELRRVQAELMRALTTATPTPTADKAKAPQALAAQPPAAQTPAAQTPAAQPPAAPPPAAVAPKDLVPTNQRPEWADQPARLENGRILVTTSPYPTGAECDAALVDLLKENVKKYVAHRLGPEAAQEVRLPLDHLRTRVVKGYWLQPITLSMGEMVQLHALMQFDHEANVLIDQQWQQVYAQRRIWIAAGGLAAVLYLLAIAYGYLRVDLSTKGAYRWRLRLAATTLIAVPTLALLLTVA